jgi:O-antigen/teichoic acid export membrane protein
MSLRLLIKREILLVVAAKVTNGTSTLLLNLYAMHFMAPSEFGGLTLCTTFLLLLDGLFGAAIDLAVVKTCPEDGAAAERIDVERSALTLKAIGCVLCGGILVMFSHQLGNLFLHTSDARPLFLAWSIAATMVLLMRSSQLALQMRHRYTLYTSIELLNTSLRIVLVVIVLHGAHRSSAAVMACFAIGSSVACLAGITTLSRLTGAWRWWGLNRARDLARAGGTALATYGVSALIARFDVMIFAVFGSPSQLGLYGSAMTLATIPEIVSTYLAPALLPKIGQYSEDGVLATFYKRFHLSLYALMLVGYGVALLALPQLGPHILPSKYQPAITIVLWLLPGTLATASIFPLILNLLMLRNSRVLLIFDCIAIPCLVFGYRYAALKGVIQVAAVTTIFRLVKAAVAQNQASLCLVQPRPICYFPSAQR